jgi:hypothetical protein
MFDKGGIPMYPALVFAGLMLLTWAAAVVVSYLDKKSADFDSSSGEKERKAA